MTSDPQAAIQASLNLAEVSGVYDAKTLDPWLGVAKHQTSLDSVAPGSPTLRWGLRALAATLPDIEGLHDLATRLHAMVGHDDLNVADYMLILDGRTGELSRHIIQDIGRCLTEGLSYAATATHVGVYRDTVAQYDRFLGLHQRRTDDLVSKAITLLDQGDQNVRRLGRRLGLTHYEARTIVASAQKIRKVRDGKP